MREALNAPQSEQADVRITCEASPAFEQWISQAGGSLAVTTYQAGKVALVGWSGQQITLLMRHFDKPMGLAARDDRLALATRHEVVLFANARPLAHDYLEDQPGRYDSLYLPRVRYYTGELNVHDLAYDEQGLLAVNTRFCCLARVSDRYSFEPIWQPSFITDLVPEDRCHLNGLAIRDGAARYVTALGTTDTAGGWRENKASGGVLIDIQANEIVLDGLCMPHSPRWYGGKLWVLNSGLGELWQVDVEHGTGTPVCQLPGYLRGLGFVGPYALVALSKIRERHIFGGLPIQERVKDLICGVAVVDLRSGQQVGLFEFTSGCEELFEVAHLPQAYRPMIVNSESPALPQTLTNPGSSFWLRASSEIRDENTSATPAENDSEPNDINSNDGSACSSSASDAGAYS